MAERVNDLIPLIASQDQTGCSPSTLTVGLVWLVFPAGRIDLRCNALMVFAPPLQNFRLKKTVKAKSELKIYWVS